MPVNPEFRVHARVFHVCACVMYVRVCVYYGHVCRGQRSASGVFCCCFCPGLGSIAKISTENKIHLRKKGLIWFTFLGSRSVTEGRLGRNSPRVWNTYRGGGKLFTGLLSMARSTCSFIQPKITLPRGRIKPQWAGPFRINHLSGKWGIGLPTGPAEGSNPQLMTQAV